MEAQRQTDQLRQAFAVEVHGAEPGLYIEFESPPGVELKLESLENRSKGIELLAVQSVGESEGITQRAAVFVPEGKLAHFASRFQEYATESTGKGEPRHRDLVDRISTIRRATLRALWTDAAEVFPSPTASVWMEVWLRRHDGRELERLLEFTAQMGLEVGERRIAFHDRLVVLVMASTEQLSASLEVLNDIAEVRLAKHTAAICVETPPEEQARWVADLRRRTSAPTEGAPAVCVLDTGVTRGHPLLVDVIAEADATAVDPAWGAHDDGGGPAQQGHGTEMVGLAAYGDLALVLASDDPVILRHRVESVKILPPRGSNPPALYGAITAQAVTRPEITSPRRLRIFSLAVTADDQRDRGQPTSWSAALDALAAGRTFDPATQGLIYLDQERDPIRRLFFVSAGNVVNLDVAHLDRSDVETISDPAQAWNVVTVGAFTEKALITDSQRNGWIPIARPGDLSPWSTTSVTFQEAWPIKPDVVFEGGNVASSGSEFDVEVPELCLLSTHYRPADRAFTLSCATSAATAQVGRLAAIIRADYPDFWPETIRALVVHSARWTQAMQAHLGVGSGKRERARLARRYGFGVPNLKRALRSANDALTLVVQSTIHPFADGKMREMHLHELPWPRTALGELGQTPVQLRITLSYFVEPNPGRRGWRTRHRYASHGLRFDVKSPTESTQDFRKRLNQRALNEDEGRPTTGDTEGWFLGEQARNKGSIHSDVWTGTAADLAQRGVVGIHPVSGWWKDLPRRDRSAVGARYALVMSIETEAEVDIWTPVAEEIGVPVEISS